MLAYCENGSRRFAVHVRIAELMNTVKIVEEPRV